MTLLFKNRIHDFLQNKLAPPPNVLRGAFEKQLNFINDPAKLKSLFCTRRSAKSFTGGLQLVNGGQSIPGVNTLYIGLTRDTAKNIMWKDVLKKIDHDHKLGMKFNETYLTATLPNDSTAYLMGVDSSEKEKNKILGRKYKDVVIDEAASFQIDLRELVYGILKPAMADLRGTISLSGTSGNINKGLFYDIVNGVEAGWSRHEWTAHDNPYVAKQWQEELDEIARDRPLFMETPLFKQWYLNKWVVDDSKLIYKYDPDRNLYQILPTYDRRFGWQFVLGVDLGHDDDSAFVLMTYHEFDPTLYIISSFKKPKMDITDVANKIKDYQRDYSLSKIVIDGSNKQAVQEMRNRHGLTLDAADKREKFDFIQLMNAEFIQGRIKLHFINAQDLADEYRTLIKNERAARWEEHPNCPNHLCDAALYGWRYCYQYLSQMPVPKPKAGSPEWIAAEEKRMISEATQVGKEGGWKYF